MSTDLVDALDVSELTTDAELGGRRFTLRRARPTTYADEGVAQPAFSEAQIAGNVQRARTKDLQLLPEGTRIDETIAVWAPEELRVGNGEALDADVLVIDGQSYRVVRCTPWPQAGYWKAFATRFLT